MGFSLFFAADAGFCKEHGSCHVPCITAKLWKRVIGKYKEFPDFINNFTFQGRTTEIGEKISFIDQANTLTEIGQTKTDSFYRGRLADKIVTHAQSTGGYITKDDLLNHQAEWVEPIFIHYKGFDVHEIPPKGDIKSPKKTIQYSAAHN